MQLKRYNTAKEYLDENLEYLEKAEAINNLIIGISLSKINQQEDNSVYLSIVQEKEILFTGIKTAGRYLMIYGNNEQFKNYADLLVEYLKKENLEIPGIIGPKALALNLGNYMSKKLNRRYKINFNQLIYVLTEVKYNPAVTGEIKKAEITDLKLISNWFWKFLKEALVEEDKAMAEKSAIKKIENEEVYIWNDEKEVTMSCIGRPTNNGITISYVYTPEEHRKKGYATKIVAELSDKMLKRGYKYCTLFTNMDNPTSNSIYKKIGYEPIEEFIVIEFLKN